MPCNIIVSCFKLYTTLFRSVLGPLGISIHLTLYQMLMRFMSNKSVAHPQQVCQMNVILCFQEMKKGEWMWKEVFIIQTIK